MECLDDVSGGCLAVYPVCHRQDAPAAGQKHETEFGAERVCRVAKATGNNGAKAPCGAS